MRRSFYDAYTAHHHIRAVAFLGVTMGIFLLNEYVVRKDLRGSPVLITLLLLIPVLGQLIVVFGNPMSPGGVLGARPFRTVAMPIHLLLLLPVLGVLPRDATALVALLATCGLVQTFLVPVQNSVLARNYGSSTRGRNYGRAHAVQALAIVLVSVPAGALLDRRPDAWPWLYLVAGIAAVLGYRHFSRLKRRRAPPRRAGELEVRSPWEALRLDRPFRRFEAWFMLYGLGFLMLQPVLPIYLSDERGVTYGQVALARGAIFFATMVIVSPFVGRLADRIGVLRLAALAFFTLAGFPVVLFLVPGVVGLFVAYAVYGLAMSGVFVVWTLGPMLYAGDRDASPYLNAHLGLVGVRALVGMVAGTVIQQTLGTAPVFAVVAALEIGAGLGMLRLAGPARGPEAAAAP